jgi:2-oxoglutarate dehydrogenase E2 component (dihydrolipoamide succinyltransferase)
MDRTADVLAPQNEEGTKATVLRWCKSAGEAIRKDEPLLELETDKVTVEIPSPASGEIAEILTQANEEVLPGQLLARVRLTASTPSSEAPPPGAAVSKDSAGPVSAYPPDGGRDRATIPSGESGRSLMSPAVRRLLSEHALTLSEVSGSGRGGRVTAQDVARHLSAFDGEATASRRLPHTAVRRRVAEHMAKSLAEAPHVTTVFEADLTRVQAHRALHAAEYQRQGCRLTYTAYFVAACARALMAHPAVNSTFHRDALEVHADANIGVGTALGNEGLIVPVLRRAQTLTLPEAARRLGDLVAAARAGKLTPQDVRGGTFTISNHGVGGSVLAAPIVINQPQVAILGVGKVERRLCVVDGPGWEAIAIRTMCYLTLTLDHRALDAFQANAFLAHVVATLESWDEEPPGQGLVTGE